MRDGLFIKLQTNYFEDRKMLHAGPLGCELYNRACCLAKDGNTDGVVWREQLQIITTGFPSDIDPIIEKLEDLLPGEDRPAWTPIEGGWIISAFLDHNKSAEEIEDLRAKRSHAGRIGGLAKKTPKVAEASGKQTTMNGLSNSNSVSVRTSSTPNNTSKARAGRARQSLDLPTDPEDNGGEYAPEPGYEFDPTYQGAEELEYWQKRIGRIQPAQLAFAQSSLMRLHNWCRLSKAEIHALVEHVANDEEARGWWGVGASPANWMETQMGKSEPLWIRVRKDWLRKGGHVPSTPAVDTLGPAPAPDPNCSCRRGWVEDTPCRSCELGKWLSRGGRV